MVPPPDPHAAPPTPSHPVPATPGFWQLPDLPHTLHGPHRTALAWAAAVLLAAVFFLTQLPQLRWLDFTGGSENLNIATVLELRRADSWWVPTLRGQPRLIKPPLTAWVTASFVSDATLAALDHPEPARRHAAYRDLAFETRLPALLATTLTLLAVFEAGRLLLGRRAGLIALAVAATCLLTLRFGRFATTDVMLTLFTSWGFVALLHGVLRGRRWTALPAAGALLGLAMMSKGPVAFLFTLLPVAVLIPLLAPRVPWRPLLLPTAAAALLFIAFGLGWYIDQFRVHGPDLLRLWRVEVFRDGATALPPDPWYTYLALVPMLLPWSGFFLAACIALLPPRPGHRTETGLVLGLLAALLVMSLFKDKNERYLLPAVLASSVLTASALLRLYTAPALHRLHRPLRDAAMAVPWAMGLGLAVGGALGSPLAASAGLVRADGSPWHGWPVALLATGVLAALFATGAALQRRYPLAPFITAALGMLPTAALFLHGYAHAPGGVSTYRPIADLLRSNYANRPIVELRDTDLRFDHELNIYLNRVLPGVTSAADMSAPDAVLLMLRRPSSPPPTPPDSWTLRHRLPAYKRVVFILERTATTGPTTSPASPATPSPALPPTP
ncbi:MAG: ArnT family glycosyltransferase [Tepidisphaerales bacterium]